MNSTVSLAIPDLIRQALYRGAMDGKPVLPAITFLRGIAADRLIEFDAEAWAAVETAFFGNDGDGFEIESADLVALFEDNLDMTFVARARDTGIFHEEDGEHPPSDDLISFTVFRPDADDEDKLFIETAYIAATGIADSFLAALEEDSLRIQLRAEAFIDDDPAGLAGLSGTDDPATEEEMMTVLGWLYLLMLHHEDGKPGFATLER